LKTISTTLFKGESMKRLIFASIAILLSMGVAQAWRPFRGGCNDCPRPVRSCATRCETTPQPPVCYKEIKVPKTIMETKMVQVPARMIRIKQPDEIRWEKQPCVRIEYAQPPIQQPNIVVYEQQPDKCVHVARPDVIRYECPDECKPC